LVEKIKKNEVSRTCSTYGEGIGRLHKGFWWGNLRERNYLENPDVDGRAILKWILKKCVGETKTGFVWLWIGTGGGLLCMW